MAIPYVTGAAYLYVGVGASKAPVFLGTAQQKPRIRIKRNYTPVMNDIGGEEPFDWSYQGQAGMVSVVLSRWNESVYNALANEPNPLRALPLVGNDFDGDIGTLINTENVSIPLWVRYPYGPAQLAPKVAMVANTMRAGYRFLAAFLLGPDDLEPGTRPYQITLNFYCTRVYVPAQRRFFVYDQNMVGLPNPD